MVSTLITASALYKVGLSMVSFTSGYVYRWWEVNRYNRRPTSGDGEAEGEVIDDDGIIPLGLQDDSATHGGR